MLNDDPIPGPGKHHRISCTDTPADSGDHRD